MGRQDLIGDGGELNGFDCRCKTLCGTLDFICVYIPAEERCVVATTIHCQYGGMPGTPRKRLIGRK